MASTCCSNGLWMVLSDEKFAPVPLTKVSVKASITNLLAVVHVKQTFKNVENQPIEAVYKFPLDKGASVWKFSAEVNGREIIQSVVKENVQPDFFNNYGEDHRRAQSAFMMHETLPTVFKVKVGKVAAKSSVIIRITYTTELKMEGEEVRFYLPSTIANRYITSKDESPSTDSLSKINSDADDVLSNINYTEKIPFKLRFEAIVSMTSGIKDIRSPTHKISTSNDHATKRKVTLSKTSTSMDQDLVLYIKVDHPYEGTLILEKAAEGSSALMLSILPKFEQKEHKAELIFAVDRSGSMRGDGIKQAKQALLLFLHSLPIESYVNIIGFGSEYHFLFPEGSRKYGGEVPKIAMEYAEGLDSDLGGTEILEPLEAVLKLPTIKEYHRQVFVLTDGTVSNKDEVISLVQKYSGQARVFALGLGSRASRDLVEGIARAGNGTALFASNEEGLNYEVMEQLRDALHPSWTNVQIEWEGYKKEDVMTMPIISSPFVIFAPNRSVPTEPLLRQAPTVEMIPPVFSGKHLVVYALLKKGAHIPQKATLTVRTPEKTFLSIKILLDPMTTDGLLVHRMAVKKLIHGLQDRSDEHAKWETIRLSCIYELASSFTTLFAVDPRKPNTTLKGSLMVMKSSDVPVQHGVTESIKVPISEPLEVWVLFRMCHRQLWQLPDLPNGRSITIGSHPSCSICIRGPEVGEVHCRLSLEKENWMITADNWSKWSTYLGSKLTPANFPIAVGSNMIGIGNNGNAVVGTGKYFLKIVLMEKKRADELGAVQVKLPVLPPTFNYRQGMIGNDLTAVPPTGGQLPAPLNGGPQSGLVHSSPQITLVDPGKRSAPADTGPQSTPINKRPRSTPINSGPLSLSSFAGPLPAPSTDGSSVGSLGLSKASISGKPFKLTNALADLKAARKKKEKELKKPDDSKPDGVKKKK